MATSRPQEFKKEMNTRESDGGHGRQGSEKMG